MFRGLAVLSLVLSSAAPAMSGPKQPTGKWVVNFADAQCIATRNYGSERDPLYLVLKAPVTGNALQIGLVRKGSRPAATQADGEIIFSNGNSARVTLLDFGTKDSGQRALITILPSSELQSLRHTSSVRIRAHGTGITTTASRVRFGGGGATDETLAVTQMASLLEVLDDCTADLRKVWHVWSDESPSPHLKEGAMGNLTGIFKSEDYPGIAVFKEQMGSVAMVLLVDEQGKVADCMAVETSGIAALDAQSCAIIKERARFKPAVGLDGKPAKSSFFQRITWRLEGV